MLIFLDSIIKNEGTWILKHMVKRIALLPVMLLAISLLVFLAVHFAPGDAALMILGNDYTPKAYRALRAKLGLDDPLHVQYARFLWNILQGDFGRSYHTNLKVTSEIMRALPISLSVTVFAMAIGILIGITTGIIAAVKYNSIFDSVLRVLTVAGVSIPIFWLGLLLILVFSVHLGVLPTSGVGGIEHLILPGICLGTYPVSAISRLTRASILEVLEKEYLTTARAKGLSEKIVVGKHALKNALIPVVTVIGIQSGIMLGGAVLTETVFALPGLGRLLMRSIMSRDAPMIQGCVLTITALFITINLVVDLLYSYFDPRIRHP